jgi:hypothetical protein
MKEFINYPEIVQFRQVCDSVRKLTQYIGKDEEGKSKYDPNIILPTLKFTGTVKAHGTNAAVCFYKDEHWFQSRDNEITVAKDNAGFAFFAESNIISFKEIYNQVKHEEDEIVVLFGEWSGGNIQKGTALTGLPKMFILFDVCIAKSNADKTFLSNSDFESINVNNSANIYHTKQFQTYELDIDFNRAQHYLPALVSCTESVENECPIGKFFGRIKDTDCTTGEGIVWKHKHERGVFSFKTKGEKHSGSKTLKIKVTHEPEVLESIDKFVAYALNENRLNQAYNLLENKAVESTGIFIKWVITDILKEEVDVLIKNKLEPKMIVGQVNSEARKWFFNKLDSEI